MERLGYSKTHRKWKHLCNNGGRKKLKTVTNIHYALFVIILLK